MLAVNYTTLRNNLKEYCDRVCDEEEVLVVTRKEERNVVIMSIEQYSRIEKYMRNLQYLNMLRESNQQLQDGNVVIKTMAELEAMAADE